MKGQCVAPIGMWHNGWPRGEFQPESPPHALAPRSAPKDTSSATERSAQSTAKELLAMLPFPLCDITRYSFGRDCSRW